MATTFYLPTRIIFGAGAAAQLGEEAKKIGKKAMLVTGISSMRKTGVLDKIASDLKANGVEALVFDRVEPNPRVSTIDDGAKIVRSEGVDLVIGLGGGSAMDAAKAIVLASTGTESIWHYAQSRVEVKGPAPALLLLPTVAGSGSEGNSGVVVTNWATHEKIAFVNPHFFARVAIVDPELTLTLPKKPTAQGGVDVFCHLAEIYLTARSPSPITDGILESIMGVVVRMLPQALAKLDDIEARTQLSWASSIAMSQFARLGGGAGVLTLHGIEHPLSGYYDIAHGDGLAALLPSWMRFTFPVAQERFYSLGKKVFAEEDGVTAAEKWLEKVGMKLRLQGLGVKADRIDEMADCAVRTASWLKYHPKLLDAAATAQIYRDSY